MRGFRTFLFLIACTGVFVFLPHLAHAVTISQPIFEANAKPGDVIESQVEIYDDSMQGVTVYPWVYNFIADQDREGSITVLTDPKDLKPDREWVEFDQKKVELPAAGTLVKFPYRIRIPANGEPGSHLIAIAFRTRPSVDPDPEGSIVYVGGNVVTSVFLKVSGEIVDAIDADFQSGIYTTHDSKLTPAELKPFFLPKKFFIKPPVEFLLTIYNRGNTHQKPDGNVRVVNDLFGGDPEKLSVNPENKIILPGTDRTLSVPTFGQGFMFGKYRAKLTLLYGNPLREFTTETSFWIVPVVELLIALGILLLLVLLLLLIWYLLNKRRDAREREIQEKMRQEMLRFFQATGQTPPPHLSNIVEEADKGKRKENKSKP